MCYKVECKGCGKTGWGGCGKHLVPLYNGIQKGSHCLCRSWPGVAVAPVPSSASLEQPASNQLKDVDQPPPPPATGAASGSVATATAGSAEAGVKIA